MAPATWVLAEGRTVSLQRSADRRIVNGVLLPGLVNAHAHLDLAGADPVPVGQSFADWLAAIAHVRQAGRNVAGEACREACALRQRGVVAVGDIDASGGEGVRGRRRDGLTGVSFLEIVGLQRDSARARLAGALRLMGRLGGGRDELGISPHAPYSVHADVLAEAGRTATRLGLRLAMHLAETDEETRYLLRGDGPFRAFLGRMGPGTNPPGIRPVALAARTGLLGAGCLVVHGNDLDDTDIAVLAEHGSSVVYCHGTHRYFDRPPHRFRDLVSAGVNVALGTDSAASNPGVDLFQDMIRMVADRPDIAPDLVLHAATVGGRMALGLPAGPCRFDPGSRADAVLLGPAPDDVESATPRQVAQWVLSGEADVWMTFHAGIPVKSRSRDFEDFPESLDSLSGRH